VSEQPLVCPGCRRPHPGEVRFCEACGMPLVESGAELHEPSADQMHARKIKPQYAEGRAVKVARAPNLAQADFLAGLLLEEGIPSYVSSPINGHGGLAGARDVLVPESGAEAAREALSPPGGGGGAR
jgi:putative signal transducing protein